MRHRSTNSVHSLSQSRFVVVVVGVVVGWTSVVGPVEFDSLDEERVVSEDSKEGGKVAVAVDANFLSMAASRKAKARVNTITRQTAEQYLTSCHTVIGSSSNITIG